MAQQQQLVRLWKLVMGKGLSGKLALVFFLVVCLTACARPQLMHEDFWGKGVNQDLPAFFEATCVSPAYECGDTHFEVNGTTLYVHYTNFGDPALANDLLEKEVKSSWQSVREAILRDSSGQSIGKKYVLYGDAENGTWKHKLAWTKNGRFASILSDDLAMIEAYELDREL